MATQTPDARLEDQWRDILSVHARTMCEIDRALHPHGLGASDFEVLDILASGAVSEPGEHCRVQNIAGRVHLSQSALSRLIGRLEKDGLVERTVCEEDRRGVWVALTGKGRDLHAEVLPCSGPCSPACCGTDPLHPGVAGWPQDPGVQPSGRASSVRTPSELRVRPCGELASIVRARSPVGHCEARAPSGTRR